MITTTSEFSSQLASTPGARLANDPPMTPAEARQRRADDEGDREGELDVDAHRRDHVAVVDARADDHPAARALQPEPQAGADDEPEAEDDQARQRVLDAGDVEVDELVERPRPGDVLRDAAVVGEHLVGEDDRDRDGDQRLAQVLALVPAQEELLHEQARRRRRRRPPASAGTTHCTRLTCALERPSPTSPPTMLRCMRSAM